jgi:hypothetical protein
VRKKCCDRVTTGHTGHNPRPTEATVTDPVPDDAHALVDPEVAAEAILATADPCRLCGTAPAAVELPPVVEAVADGGRYADLDEARTLERLDPPTGGVTRPGVRLCAGCAETLGMTP